MAIEMSCDVFPMKRAPKAPPCPSLIIKGAGGMEREGRLGVKVRALPCARNVLTLGSRCRR